MIFKIWVDSWCYEGLPDTVFKWLKFAKEQPDTESSPPIFIKRSTRSTVPEPRTYILQ